MEDIFVSSVIRIFEIDDDWEDISKCVVETFCKNPEPAVRNDCDMDEVGLMAVCSDTRILLGFTSPRSIID